VLRGGGGGGGGVQSVQCAWPALVPKASALHLPDPNS
jgi:hypothetical protein